MLTPTLRLPTITQELSLNTIRYNRNLSAIQTRFTAFTRRMSDLGVGLSLALSIPLQLMGIAAIKSFATLENAAVRAASRIKGSTHETADQIANFTNQLSRRMPLPQDQLAGGIEELVKVGGSLEFSMRAVEIAARFAVAGGADLNDMIGRLTGTMFAFNLTTGNAADDLRTLGHVGDVIAFSADQTKASYTGMTDAFEKAAPIAKGLGISFEDTAAMLATMSQAMIEGGRAGTQFQMIGRDLTITFEKHKEVWKSIGVDVFDPMTHQLRSLPQIIGEIQNALGHLNPEAATKLMGDLGLPSRSRHAILAMFGLTEQAKQLRAQLGSVGGYVDGVFLSQMESFSSQMTIAKNRLTEASYAAGNALAPALRSLSSYFQGLLDSFISLAPAQQQHIMQWMVLAGALPLVLLVLSPILRTLEALIVVSYRLIASIAVMLFEFGMWVVSILPIAALVGGIALAVFMLTYALMSMSGAWDENTTRMQKFLDVIQAMIPGLMVLKYLMGGNEGMDKMKEGFKEMALGLEGYMTDAIEAVNKKMDGLLAKMKKGHEFDMVPFVNPQGPEVKGMAGIAGSAMAGMSPSGAMAFAIQDAIANGIDPMSTALSGLTAGSNAPPGMDDLTTIPKQKGSSTSHPFSAKEFGTVEEYKARVTGQAELVKATDKLLAEHKKGNAHAQKIKEDVGRIKDKVVADNSVKIEEADLT